MTPLERLLAEELPTGTFGGPRPPTPRPREPHPISPEEAATHHAELAAAIGEPHLRLVPPDRAAA